jgi:transposase-like protein
VRWYLRYGLSYRDVDELLAERNIQVDHVTVFPLGAAVHPAADRRGTTLLARSRRSVVLWTRPCAARRDVTERG